MKKIILISLLLVLPLVCFAQDEVGNKKIQELTQFLADHQTDIEQEVSHSDLVEDTSQMLSAVLDNQEMPVMLQAYHFLLLGASPEFWGDITTAEETAQIYLKILKHSNPIVRLYGLDALEEFKEQVKKPKEWQSDDDISMVKRVIEIVEAGYSSLPQEQKLFGQYKRCFVYLKPILSSQENIHVDMQGLMAVFENADPAVQFYLTFRISMAAMWSGEQQPKKILVNLSGKGDSYTRGLVALGIDDYEQVSQLLKNSANPDEFITLGAFLNSRNVSIPLDAWPDKEGLEALFNKASPYARQQILELMKTAIELEGN